MPEHFPCSTTAKRRDDAEAPADRHERVAFEAITTAWRSIM